MMLPLMVRDWKRLSLRDRVTTIAGILSAAGILIAFDLDAPTLVVAGAVLLIGYLIR